MYMLEPVLLSAAKQTVTFLPGNVVNDGFMGELTFNGIIGRCGIANGRSS
jgi:hypothetical protein